MKKYITILLFILSSKLLFGQKPSSEYDLLVKKADSIYQLKDYKNSALTYSSAFKTRGWKGAGTDRYRAALSWAMANNPDSAFFNLDRLVDRLHFADYDSIAKEKDFYPLHTDTRWNPLLVRVEKNVLPKGCIRTGSSTTSYRMFIADSAGQTGNKVFTIQSIDEKIEGFGALMQNTLPKEFLGRKIRMTAYLKSKAVGGWAGLWLRIDQPNPDALNSFDNMHDRGIRGTKDWKKYEIVLYVPLNATNIAFGALLSGTGQIWFDKLNFEIVDKSVPTTGSK